MKKFAVVLLGGLIAVVGVLVWRAREGGGEAVEPRKGRGSGEEATVVQQVERAEVERSADEPEARSCAGRVVLEGMSGEERKSFGLLFVEVLDAKGERTRSERIEVKEGKFGFEARGAEWELEVLRFESDGWVAEALGKRVKLADEFECRIGAEAVEHRVAMLEVVVEARAFPPGRTPTHAELRPQFDPNDPRLSRPVLKLPLEFRPTDGALVVARSELAAGKWRLTLVPLNIAREIELAPGDSRIERFVLGDPAQLILEIQDAMTGKPLDDATVRFGWIDSGERASQLEPVAREAGSSMFVIVAPSGRIDLSVSAPRHLTRRLPVDIPASTAPFVVRLEPSEDLEVRFELRRGDALVPIAPDLWSKVTLDPTKSAGSLVRLAFQSTGTDSATPYLTLVVSRSGAYELLVPAEITGSEALSVPFTVPVTTSDSIPIQLP